MQPNSMGVVWLTWLVAVCGLCAAVVSWPRFAKPTMGAVIGRIASQLLSALLVVVAVAATLNQQNGWYATWSDVSNDVLGQQPTATHETVTGAQTVATEDPAIAARANKVADSLYAGSRRDSERHWHHGGAAGKTITVAVPGLHGALANQAHTGLITIWLPPAYFKNPNRTFPVLVAYHGQPGSPANYLGHGLDLPGQLNRLVWSGKLANTVVVIPNLMPAGMDTECVNTPQFQMETWLTKAVPQYVLSHLRVRSDRQSWAVMGYSMGGYCAAMSAILHPERYGSAILLGTYFNPNFGGLKPFAPGTTPQRYQLLRAARSTPPSIRAWIELSGKDRWTYAQGQSFVAEAKAPMQVTSVTYPDAGHRFDIWAAATPVALRWLGASVPAFHGDPDRRQAHRVESGNA